MTRQLDSIVDDLHLAQERLRTLGAMLPCSSWSQRPAPARWSPAECVAHLNLTSEALLPLLRQGLREARDRRPQPAASRYRHDPIGWLIWHVMAPSGRVKTTTIPAFVPSGERSADSLMEDFDRLQAEIVASVREAADLPIDRVTVVSPFSSRVRYSLYSALTVIPRHQHRHLCQAERAADVGASLASALAV